MKEYTRFGNKVLQREKDSGDDWQEVPEDDRVEAEIEVRVSERLRDESRAKGGQFSVEFLRTSES